MSDTKTKSATVGQVLLAALARYPELSKKWSPSVIRDWERLADILKDISIPAERKERVIGEVLSLFRNLPKQPEVFTPLSKTGSPGDHWRKSHQR